MKTVHASLLSSQTLCTCLKVVRADGLTLRFTSADDDVIVATGNATYDGTYVASFGLEITNLVAQAGLAVDNMDLQVLPDETSYPQNDILAGRWNGSTFRLFETDYSNPIHFNLLKRGTTGEVETLRGGNRLEFRSMKQALQQLLGAVTTKVCRWRLFSDSLPDGLCLVDPATWTHTVLVTAVASRHEFTCSAAIQADDYFGEGTVTFNDGENAGYAGKVKAFSAGVFTLSLDMPFDITVGDELVAQAGCRKRLEEDCRDKFDNVLNFGGEPHVPGADALTKDPEIVG